MGRLDLLDVYRDEDDFFDYDEPIVVPVRRMPLEEVKRLYDSPVDSPLNGAERQGTRSSSGATGESDA